MKKGMLSMDLVGPDFAASYHLDAVCRLGNVEVGALAGFSLERTERKAAELGVQKAYCKLESNRTQTWQTISSRSRS